MTKRDSKLRPIVAGCLSYALALGPSMAAAQTPTVSADIWFDTESQSALPPAPTQQPLNPPGATPRPANTSRVDAPGYGAGIEAAGLLSHVFHASAEVPPISRPTVSPSTGSEATRDSALEFFEALRSGRLDPGALARGQSFDATHAWSTRPSSNLRPDDLAGLDERTRRALEAMVAAERAERSDPVLPGSGEMVLSRVDLELPGIGLPVRLERTYRSRWTYDGPLGFNWTHTYNQRLDVTFESCGLRTITWHRGDGHALVFHELATGGFEVAEEQTRDALTEPTPMTFEVRAPDGLTYHFRGEPGRELYLLDRVQDLQARALTLTWQNVPGTSIPRLTELGDTMGRQVFFNYDSDAHLDTITVPSLSVTVDYTVDHLRDLVRVENAGGIVERYAYSPVVTAPVATHPARGDVEAMCERHCEGGGACGEAASVCDSFVRSESLACRSSCLNGTNCRADCNAHCGPACAGHPGISNASDGCEQFCVGDCQNNIEPACIDTFDNQVSGACGSACLDSCNHTCADTIFCEFLHDSGQPSQSTCQGASCAIASLLPSASHSTNLPWYDGSTSSGLRYNNSVQNHNGIQGMWRCELTDGGACFDCCLDGNNCNSTSTCLQQSGGCNGQCRDTWIYGSSQLPSACIGPDSGGCRPQLANECVGGVCDDMCRDARIDACNTDCANDCQTACASPEIDARCQRVCDPVAMRGTCESQCYDACLEENTPSDGTVVYGDPEAIRHNLALVIDGEGRTVLNNIYERDIESPAYDRVTRQFFGASLIEYDYADLADPTAPRMDSADEVNIGPMLPTEVRSTDVCPSACIGTGETRPGRTRVWRRMGEDEYLVIPVDVERYAMWGPDAPGAEPGWPVEGPPTLGGYPWLEVIFEGDRAVIVPPVPLLGGVLDIQTPQGNLTLQETEPGQLAVLSMSSEQLGQVTQDDHLTLVAGPDGIFTAVPGAATGMAHMRGPGRCADGFIEGNGVAGPGDFGPGGRMPTQIFPSGACEGDVDIHTSGVREHSGPSDPEPDHGLLSTSAERTWRFEDGVATPLRDAPRGLDPDHLTGGNEIDCDLASPLPMPDRACEAALANYPPGYGPTPDCGQPGPVRGLEMGLSMRCVGPGDDNPTVPSECLAGFGAAEEQGAITEHQPIASATLVRTAGRSWLYLADAHGRVLRVTDEASGGTMDFNYGGHGQLVGVRHEDGQRTCATYSDQRQIVRQTNLPIPGVYADQPAVSVSYAWGSYDRLRAVSAPGTQRAISRYDYDTLGRLTTASSHADRLLTRYEYDGQGRVARTHRWMGLPGQPDSKVLTTRYTPHASGGWQTMTVDEGGPDAHTTTVQRDGFGRITHASAPNRPTVTRTWSPDGRLLEESTSDGLGGAPLTTTHVYDDSGLVLHSEGPLVTQSYGYNPRGEVTWVSVHPASDPSDARITCHEYDLRGDLLQSIDPEGRVTRLSYDGAGRVTAVHEGIDASVLSESWASPCSGNLTDGATAGMERRVQLGRRASDGRVEWRTFGQTPTGHAAWHTQFTYDGYGRVIESRSADVVTRYGHDAASRQIWSARYFSGLGAWPAGQDADGQPDLTHPLLAGFSRAQFDDWDRPTESESLWFEFDGNGQRQPLHEPGSPPGWLRTRYVYDLSRQETTTTNPRGEVARVRADRFGRTIEIQHPGGVSQEVFQYLDDGNTVVRTLSPAPTPSQQLVTRTEQTPFGAVARTCADTQCLDVVESFTYDAYGRPDTATSGGSTYAYGYDDFGALDTIQRVTAVGARRPYLSHTFNRNGLLVSTTDANSNVTQSQYDGLNRLARQITATGTTEYGYRPGTGAVSDLLLPSGATQQVEYDSQGHAIDILATDFSAPYGWSSTRVRRSYDALGLVYATSGNRGDRSSDDVRLDYRHRNAHGRAHQVESTGPMPYVVDLRYDGLGRLVELNHGSDIAYEYDADGRLDLVQVDGAPFLDPVYSGAGAAVQVDHGNGLSAQLTYDDRGRLTGRFVEQGGSQFAAQDLYWGADQQIRRIDRQTAGQSATSDLFATDAYGRLARADLGRTSMPAMTSGAVGNATVIPLMSSGSTELTLDDADNRTAVTTAGSPRGFGVGPDNRVSYVGTPASTTAHDQNGALTDNAAGATYDYDGFGRLVTITDSSGVTELTYDPFGNVASRVTGTTTERFLFIGGHLAVDDIDGRVRQYIPGGQGGAYGLVDGGDVLTLHFGWGGRLGWVSDGQGALVEEVVYDFDGKPTFRDDTGQAVLASVSDQRLLMTGRLFFADHGLFALGARWYAPELGRFLSQDPAGLFDGPNRYAYVGGQPIMFVDPDGLWRRTAYSCSLGSCHGKREEGPNTLTHPRQMAELISGTVVQLTEAEAERLGLGPNATAVFVTAAQFGTGAATGFLTAPFVLEDFAGSPGRIVEGIDLLQHDSVYMRWQGVAVLSGEGSMWIGVATPLVARTRVGQTPMSFKRRGGADFDAPSACPGPGCPGGGTCFVAGTTVETPRGSAKIERLRVGDRVTTMQGGSATEVDAQWRVVELEMPNPTEPRDTMKVVLLRSPAWLAAHGVKEPGDRVFLDMEEISVEGWSTVTAVLPAPAIVTGPGRVVLATVSHFNDNVYELSFEEGIEPLRPTAQHKLYSLDRDDWVRVRDLRIGERLQTAKGAVTIQALERVRGGHEVFNLEVETDHEFLVGPAAIRAHNTDCPPPLEVRPDFIGEEHGKQAFRGFPKGSKVKYLDDAGRRAHRLDIKDGQLYDSNGKLFDTGEHRAIFVEDMDGNIYARTMKNPSKYHGEFHHSSFTAGGPVRMAGEFRVTKGRIGSANERSGHYQPTRMNLYDFLDRMDRVHGTNNQGVGLLSW